MGFSSSTFSDINENDAIAAVKAWAQALAKERHIEGDPQPEVFKSRELLEESLTNRTVDTLCMSAEEYWLLKDVAPLDHLVLGTRRGTVTEDYLLLVHRDSGIQGIAGLRGRRVMLLQTSVMSLAPVWLETMLLKNGLGRIDGCLGRVGYSSKLNKVILPVFFRQQDACVVTRKGFDTAVELNPQLGQQLNVIASSPSLVPFLFCFRADFDSKIKSDILAELESWNSTPAGQQSLTIFHCESLEEHPMSILDSALELLETHRRLLNETNAPATVIASRPANESKGGAD